MKSNHGNASHCSLVFIVACRYVRTGSHHPLSSTTRAEKANQVQQNTTTVVRGLTLLEVLDGRRNDVWRARIDDRQAVTSDETVSDVAVKFLHPAYEAVVPGGFGRKARSLRRVVRHEPGWVRPIGHGYASDGRRYVISPLHRGSLDDQLQHGPTPWYPATSLISEAAAVMATAHAAGVASGHLRPSGLLLDEEAGTRVVAYGTSTRRFDDGTAQFMAPEVTTGADPIPASDVFSLSLILASLIAGRAIDHSEPAESVITELRGSAPERILEIIDYGLSVNLRNRFADADKMARALHAARHEQGPAGLRGDRGRVPPDAVDPLEALLAGPLLGVADGATDESPDRAADTLSEPIHDVDRAEDDVPTAIPFDAAAIMLDDPTDPGITGPAELDAATDHFGALPLLDVTVDGADPAPHPVPVTSIPLTPPPDPLADLLTSVQEPETSGPSDNDVARPPKPIGPSDVARSDRFHDRPSPLVPGDGSDTTRRLEYNPDAFTPPSRFAVWADSLGHVVALNRRRIASSLAVIGITGAIGAAVLVGAGSLMSRSVTISGGTPVSTSVVEQQPVERSSPLNDQSPLDTARSLRYEDIPTTRAVRRTTPTTPTSATTSDAGEGSTSAPGESTSTTDDVTEPSEPGRTTTTAASTITSGAGTSEPRTTTTQATTSTTKRKGRPNKP